MQPLSFSTRVQIESQRGAVVYVEGDVDVSTSLAMQEALAVALDSSATVAVDLEGVRFIDSSGLSALVWGHRGAQEAGGSLTIRNPSRVVRRLLDITGLDSLIPVEPANSPDVRSESGS